MSLKWLTFLLLLSTLGAKAQTINAASCNESDVSTALNSVTTDGTTVNIPAGTCTWTTSLSYNQVHAMSIIGAGSLTTTGGGDATVIVDNYTTNASLLVLNLSSSKTLRMAGLTFKGGSGGIKDNGMIAINGPGTVRLDHSHFNFQTYSSCPRSFIVALGTQVIGVMDHSVLDECETSTLKLINGSSDSGNTTWTQPTGFGTNNFFFIEANTINGSATTSTVFESRGGDCWTAGRYVFRFNTLTMSAGPEQHATGHAGDDRGCRAQEVYNNTYNLGAGQPANGVNYDMIDMGSGPTLAWGNVAPGVLKNVLLTDVTRKDNTTYGQSSPPGGWGYCGTAFNGTGSNWDQNSNASTGYACLDQPGRGAGDLLSGVFPNKCNKTLNSACNTFTGQWPRQALEPMYFWNNNASPASGWGGVFWSDDSGGRLTANVDYYPAASGVQTSSTSPFNGASGTGWGTLANRPTTCTTGVGYWATDQGSWNSSGAGGQGQLYTCTATNTWTLYYTPYAYPHPLTQGSGTTAPATPTSLQATVQ